MKIPGQYTNTQERKITVTRFLKFALKKTNKIAKMKIIEIKKYKKQKKSIDKILKICYYIIIENKERI